MNAHPCGCDRREFWICERHQNILDKSRPFRIRVILESPLSAPDREGIERNKMYARMAMRDSIFRGEAPFASHLLYDQPSLLDDTIPDEREIGMLCGFEWLSQAEMTVVYCDLGISSGMRAGIKLAEEYSRKVKYRHIL
jgi:hypothetical protein